MNLEDTINSIELPSTVTYDSVVNSQTTGVMTTAFKLFP